MQDGKHANCEWCRVQRAQRRKKCMTAMDNGGEKPELSKEQWNYLLDHRIEDELRKGIRPRFAKQ